ncbi:MAG: hypothetical protein HQ537_02090 [Parcubacteria group bacterium]|nr:hypothetical protein [Parcubacteria group bacterium]
MKNKNIILLALVLVLGLLIGGVFVKYTTLPCDSNISKNNDVPNSTNSTATENNNDDKLEDTDITYATFSSHKADFTFEYPDTWVYAEREFNDTMVWGFYPNLDNNYDSVPPYLEVHSPIYDPGAVSFYSGGGPDSAKGSPFSFTLSVFPTNDPMTFVTYERYGAGENGGGYIYWQKGEYFANASFLLDYDKYNLIRFYSAPENGREIGQHIARSIKIK